MKNKLSIVLTCMTDKCRDIKDLFTLYIQVLLQSGTLTLHLGFDVIGNIVSMTSARFTPMNTHSLCIVCLGVEHACSLGVEHACSALKGAGLVHCDKFTVRKLHSHTWASSHGMRYKHLHPVDWILNPYLLARAICWLRKHILWDLHDPADSQLLMPSSSEELDVVGEGEESF